MSNRIDLSVELVAVVMAVTEDAPRVLLIREPDLLGSGLVCALPAGPLDADGHRTLELALRQWVADQTGLSVGYVEQLYTFGDRDRDLARRRVSVAYLALVYEPQAGAPLKTAAWHDVYDFFPWEDHRDAAHPLLDAQINPALHAWISSAADAPQRQDRAERAAITFGLHDPAHWDGDRALDRYELLYELRLVEEFYRDRAERVPNIFDAPRPAPMLGQHLSYDHRRIFAAALGRLRGKIRYRPVVFELLPPTFTLGQLQRLVEALAGVRLHKQNFRRLVEHGGFVEATSQIATHTGGRPATLFRFRRDVLRERQAPGLGRPTAVKR
jgi:hypothetical protein